MLTTLKRYFRLKRLGFIGDQLGIAHRYHIEGQGWSNHLTKTGNAIVTHLKEREGCSVAILGSGWLLDIPLDKILPMVSHAYLVDINHPKPIRHRWENNPKITFVETDITGGAASLFFDILKGKTSEEDALEAAKSLHPGQEIPKTDLVISVNILSQLAHIPAETLKEHRRISPEKATALISTFQQQHLEWLHGMDGILITDFEEELFDEQDKLCGVNPVCAIDSKRWKQIDRWRWKFDSKMTYRSDFRTYLQVGVFHPIAK